MEAKGFSIVLLILIANDAHAASIPIIDIDFADCGSQFELLSLSISTCSDLPCNVEKGNFVSFTAEFDASNSNYAAYLMKFEAFWIIDNIVQSAILSPSSCDNTASCPSVTNQGQLEFSSQIFVSSSLPTLNGVLHFKAKNSYDDVLMCYKIPVRIN